MEILFMVFMVVVSILSLFAVMVVLRDIVKEILAARREGYKGNAPIAAQPQQVVAEPQVTEAQPVACEAASEAVVATAVEEPVETEPADASAEVLEAESATEVEDAPAEDTADAEGTISFSMGQKQTLEEKYLALSAEQRGWYDEIVKYAAAVDGSKRFKNVRYEEYKVGKNRLVRLLIKRGIIHCEFMLHNSDFKNYISENKIPVRQSATIMLVEDAATVEVVKNSIDIAVAASNEEREYKKKLAREKRRAARANETPIQATEEKSETAVGV